MNNKIHIKKIAQKRPIEKNQLKLYDRFLEQFSKNISPYDYQIWNTKDFQKIGKYVFSKFEKRGTSGLNSNYIKLTLRKAHNKDAEIFTLFIFINQDMPFLVDSTLAAFRKEELIPDLVIHPIFFTERNEDGKLTALLNSQDEIEASFSCAESVICILTAQTLSNKKLKSFMEQLDKIYKDVQSAVKDWHLMRIEMENVARDITSLNNAQKKDGAAEIKDFFEWLLKDHFTFLGYRSYLLNKNEVVIEKGLGIACYNTRRFFTGDADFLNPSCLLAKKSSLFDLLNITKSSVISLVHRPVPIDVIRLERLDKKGEIIGEFQFFGLFTSSAYNQSVKDIPLLRSKVKYALKKARFSGDSHDGKALIHIMESLPRDILFQITEEELSSISIAVLNLQEKEKLILFVRKDPFDHFVSCLLYIPKDRYSSRLLENIKSVLNKAFNGVLLSWQSFLGDLPYARINFIYSFSQKTFLNFNIQELEKEIQQLTFTWVDKLKNALVKESGENKGRRLYEEFRNIFSIPYQEKFTEKIALEDINYLRSIKKVLQKKDYKEKLYISVRIQTWKNFQGNYHIKVYTLKEALILSNILPLFECLGLKIVKENNFSLSWQGHILWIHDFEIEKTVFFERGRLLKIKPLLEEAFLEILSRDHENDSFNKLVSIVGLSIRQVSLFRAYARYLKQIQFPYSQEYIATVLSRYPKHTQKLKDIFYLRFDPSIKKTRENRARRLEKEKSLYIKTLSIIQNLEEDKILRYFMELLYATQRTNFFQKNAVGQFKEIISFKIFSSLLSECPSPRPRCEIFIYGPRMEGIHLRGGIVARGGIRFSDRKEDYRTEILDLFKAQTLKNAVIVPAGAKGGFIAKKLPSPSERDAFQKEVVATYTLFIHELLNITDNLRNNTIIPPHNVIRYDEDDPYLVVAADKGTATFSDIANAISLSHNFWLGDAFASGGSHGYDHKKMGITARGAWISVSRHFSEMGINIMKTPIQVVGIGDMSGDVFGNGILLSEKIKLIGAFDHRHIFLDPMPDPTTSFLERKRLFEMPRSSWADYSLDLISKGGGIYCRSLKEVPLSLEVQRMLGTTNKTLEPDVLIKCLLKAKFDLLWLGGVGTFVKSSSESNAVVGDKQNDFVRVDARDLQCFVVGEGANLGFTQEGRIEYALHGGRINIDAIDNSAGVDCSDHEVNLKILLQKPMKENLLSYEARNRLLEEVTDEIAHYVLKDNIFQTLTLSIAQEIGVSALDQQSRFIQKLEEEGRLNRAQEFLPSDKILSERRARGIGLTRPELSVLLLHSKIYLKEILLHSSILEEEKIQSVFTSYFPYLIEKTFHSFLNQHSLKREITALCLSNFIIAHSGITFVYEMAEKSGLSVEEVVRAIFIVFHIFNLEALLEDIDTIHENASAQTALHLHIEIIRFLHFTTSWFLSHGTISNEVAIDTCSFSLAVKELLKDLQNYLTETDKKKVEAYAFDLVQEEVDPELAKKFGYLNLLGVAGCHIIYVSQKAKKPLELVAPLYLQIGEKLHLNWLREEAEKIPLVTYWDRLVLNGIIEDLYQIQAKLTSGILSSQEFTRNTTKRRHEKERIGTNELIENWINKNKEKIYRLEKIYADFKTKGNLDFAMLLIACRHLYQLS